MKLLPYGEGAVLVELADPAAVLGLRAALSSEPGLLELVPGARTLLVRFDPAATDAERVRDAVRGVRPDRRGATSDAAAVEIPVHYDGPDLAAVSAATGLSADEVVHRHRAASYTVAFCGFSPGFAYLSGLDPALRLPRLAEPRTSVPAGSVGVAGEFTGVYPRSSPGGWRLLGRTDAVLWDAAGTPPALLAPGTRVRFTEA